MDPRINAIAAAHRSGEISRRGFLERLVAICGTYPLAHHLLETNGMAMSLLSQAESARAGLASTMVKYPAEGATLEGYLSRPGEGGPFPAVLVIHENRGLNEHIRDVVRRLATEGFVALAPDLLSRQGGTASFADPDAAREGIGTLKDDPVIADLQAAYAYLQSHARVRRDRIGVLGFCWGGQRSFLYATANPDLKAAVVFYGSTPPEERLTDIQCPVLGNYGGTDTRISSQVPQTEASMQRLGKRFDAKVYPGAGHAFFNDTGDRYHEAAAQDAWSRTLRFLKELLG